MSSIKVTNKKYISLNTFLRSQLLLMGDAPELALGDVEEVLQEEPKNFQATCVKAQCMFLIGDFEQSLMVWHKARMIRANVQEVCL